KRLVLTLPPTRCTRQRQHLACWSGARFDSADGRSLFIESNVGPVLMVIGYVLTAKPQQTSLVERNDMIQHLATAAAHPSPGDSVLPRTPHARPNSLNPARLQKVIHLAAEQGVAIE